MVRDSPLDAYRRTFRRPLAMWPGVALALRGWWRAEAAPTVLLMHEAPEARAVSGLVLRGVRWKLVSQIVVQLIRIASGLVIARTLAPHEYGLAAMVVVFSGFVLAFSDLALGAALVQRKRIDEEDCSTAFWVTTLAGTLFTCVALVLAGPIAAFYGEPRVRTLFLAFAPIFLLSSLGATHQALLTRQMDFRVLELRQMTCSLAGAVVGVSAALSGAGPWAIILQQLAVTGVSSLVLWLCCPWRPGLRFSSRSVRELGSFSGNVFGTRLLYYTSENAVGLVIGRFLGATSLGLYSVAYTVILVPLVRLAVPIGEVLFPAFSRMQDEVDRLARFWMRALRLLGAVTIPALAGLVIVAPDFVPLVLGEKWQDAVPIVRVLAWVGLLQTLDAWNSGILMGLGKARTQFRAAMLFYSVFIGSYFAGVPWGVVGVAASYAIAITLMQGIYQYLTTSAVNISVLEPVRALSGVVQATAAMGLVLVAARHLLVEQGVPPFVRLVLLIPLGIVVYVPMCAWRERRIVAEVKQLWRGRAGLRSTSPAPV